MINTTRVFDSFPPDATCPVCGTSKDEACVLVPIDEEEPGLWRAVPMHLRCAELLNSMRAE